MSLFNPLESVDAKTQAKLNVRVFFELYLGNEAGLSGFAAELSRELGEGQFPVSSLISQLQPRGKVIEALESYLMAASAANQEELEEASVVGLAQGTLAYHLATPAQRRDLEDLFRAVAEHVKAKVPDAETRKRYSRCLLGVSSSLAVHAWVRENRERLVSSASDDELLTLLWPVMTSVITNSAFTKCTDPAALRQVAALWIAQETPVAILQYLEGNGVRFGEGRRPRKPHIDHVMDICENALAFEGVLGLAAISECCGMESIDEAFVDRVSTLQKRLKYGLASLTAITLHELGFSDRIVAPELAALLGLGSGERAALREKLRETREALSGFFETLPSYFRFVAQNM